MNSQPPRKRIIGYADRLSVASGDSVSFMVSCEDLDIYDADIVRLRSGDLHPDGRGLIEMSVQNAITGQYKARAQTINAGSYGIVEHSAHLASLKSFTLQAWIWPTTPGRGEQVLMGCWMAQHCRGFALCLDAKGALCLKLGNGEIQRVTTEVTLAARQWAFVGASYVADRSEVRLWQLVQPDYPATATLTEATGSVGVNVTEVDAPFLFAAAFESHSQCRLMTSEHYNGKIEAPRVFDTAMSFGEASHAQTHPLAHEHIVAAWDFARDTPTERICDDSANGLHGHLVNLPARAMKGHCWTGEIYDWKQAPQQYGAIHFHDDDIYDCGWDEDFTLRVPDDMQSGVYAARIRSGDNEDRIPFVVRPSRGAPSAKTLVLLPSGSYMAYANEHAAAEGGGYLQAFANHLMALSAQDLLLNERPDLGYSLYDVHSDGSGVCYSSRLRPILNFRPGVTNAWVGAAGTFPWQFNADLPLIDWLDHNAIDYDVVTDEDLHEQGVALLQPYQVLLTGSHPEYYSRTMHDALGAYLQRGGRLMYLGGNGFYWRIAYHETLPGVIELRRGEDGIRDWVAEGGEYYMSFTGEYGGMWERMGRTIHALVGVGMAGQGFDVCSYYRRTEASRDPRTTFIFEGVDDEIIGDFGTVGGGAAGIEVDRFDLSKGSPPNALVVASSENLSDTYYPGPEEINNASPLLDASQNSDVRADMTFFETPNGGAVFSVGSIAWIGSLTWNEFDNNVARITGNVLRRFLDETPFELP
ncbi:MAG: LamG domain-containing protein [Gammaproteobacteria bacterium]|nr:LamG domain-containing protein [Gammaproteobacteria bacterium]